MNGETGSLWWWKLSILNIRVDILTGFMSIIFKRFEHFLGESKGNKKNILYVSLDLFVVANRFIINKFMGVQ